jgi:hypothetical protein
MKIPMQSGDVVEWYIWKDGDGFAVQYSGSDSEREFPPEMSGIIRL